MSDKKLVLFEDKTVNTDSSIISKTDVRLFVNGTNVPVFRGSNKVLVSGSSFTAAKHFNLKPDALPPSYNTVLGLDHTVNEPYNGEGIRKDELIYLFAVGVGGCGEEARQKYPVNYTEWITPENLVPFRVEYSDDDLNSTMRQKYFGRKTYDGKVLYYFKAFEGQPEFIQRYADGTPIDENIYLNERNDEVESFVEINLKITKQDCRDFFTATTGIADAKINTISLLTAWKSEVDGYTYYQDIRPFSKINFHNESLIDSEKGIDIIYQIFY